eukprot:scaffold160309_cov57-Attheya_sp.AAC.3
MDHGSRGGNTVFVKERGGPIEVVGFFGREIWSSNNQPMGYRPKELNDMNQGVFGTWHIFIFLISNVESGRNGKGRENHDVLEVNFFESGASSSSESGASSALAGWGSHEILDACDRLTFLDSVPFGNVNCVRMEQQGTLNHHNCILVIKPDQACIKSLWLDPCTSELVEVVSKGNLPDDQIDHQENCIVFFTQKFHALRDRKMVTKRFFNPSICLLDARSVSWSMKKVCQSVGLDNIMLVFNKVFFKLNYSTRVWNRGAHLLQSHLRTLRNKRIVKSQVLLETG